MTLGAAVTLRTKLETVSNTRFIFARKRIRNYVNGSSCLTLSTTWAFASIARAHETITARSFSFRRTNMQCEPKSAETLRAIYLVQRNPRRHQSLNAPRSTLLDKTANKKYYRFPDVPKQQPRGLLQCCSRYASRSRTI